MTRRATRLLTGLAAALAALCAGPAAYAGEVTVAAAASMRGALETLAPLFRQETGHEAVIAAGSTGQLYAQIVNGAPYDVFLAADAVRPARLEAEGLAVAGSRFTYAIGALVLWSADPDRIGKAGSEALRRGDFRTLSIANPATAPYGAAARQVLERLDLWEALSPRIARAQNVEQAFAVVASGNAELGLVALSSVVSQRNPVPGSRWVVPQMLYDPLRQDAVLLARGADNPAAAAFLAFLRDARARRVLKAHGYALAE